MRTRLTLLIASIAAIAAFAALNWTEFVRPVQLSWGFGIGEAPLGLILLGVLVVSWLGFLVGSAYQETHYQLLAHRNAKALEAQRVLADKAEASRFVELRSYLEAQAVLAAQRESGTSDRIEHTLQQNHRELRAALDRLGALQATTAAAYQQHEAVRPLPTRPAGASSVPH